jgi:hypothetical protein
MLVGTIATAAEYRPALWVIGIPDNDWFDVLGDNRGQFAPASIKIGSTGATVRNTTTSRDTPGPQGVWQTLRETALASQSGKPKPMYACVKLLNGGNTIEMEVRGFNVVYHRNPRDCYGKSRKGSDWEPAVYNEGADGHWFRTLDPLGIDQERGYNPHKIKIGSEGTINGPFLGDDITSRAWEVNVQQYSSIVCIRAKNYRRNKTVLVLSKAWANQTNHGGALPEVVREPTDCYKY